MEIDLGDCNTHVKFWIVKVGKTYIAGSIGGAITMGFSGASAHFTEDVLTAARYQKNLAAKVAEHFGGEAIHMVLAEFEDNEDG